MAAPLKFKVGQTVTCVDDSKFNRFYKETVPVLGSFYVVRSVMGSGASTCLRLRSIINPRHQYTDTFTECSFKASRFLPGKVTMPFFTVRGPLPISAAPSYTGPGDVVGSALSWWGLRAYTSASIGSNAVRLKESGGGTEQDFATIAGGGLDLTAIAAFKGANSLTVTVLYDQTGNGVTLTAGVNAPTFTLAALGALPVMGFTTGGGNSMTTASVTQAQPNTFSTVFKMTNQAALQNILRCGVASIQQVYSDGDNSLALYAGAAPAGVTAAGGTWHAAQCIFNGASSSIVVDASANAYNPGTDGISGIMTLGAASGQNPTMSFVEAGHWGSAFNPTQYAAMDTNQSAYWSV